jgi:hypothetical protein
MVDLLELYIRISMKKKCSKELCDREIHAKGVCHNHYRELRRRSSGVKAMPRRGGECSVESCSEKHYSLGYCSSHYYRLKNTTTVSPEVPIKKLVYGQVGCLIISCGRPHYSNGVCRNHNTTYRTYGITVEKLVEFLDSSCRICNSIDTLSIDHDHSCCAGSTSCGSCVRGVLCQKCNRGIGQLNDDPELLRKAASYLEGTI